MSTATAGGGGKQNSIQGRVARHIVRRSVATQHLQEHVLAGGLVASKLGCDHLLSVLSEFVQEAEVLGEQRLVLEVHLAHRLGRERPDGVDDVEVNCVPLGPGEAVPDIPGHRRAIAFALYL